ncbi:MAG TPA: DsbA family oxidoreductase [Candidatus Cybelea sp.]|nr:DsbA family oxidoreductase [Candidatus Cybelea sp.]
MRIDIVSDTICPWCFIGKRRLERALELRPDISFEIGWRPFQLNPDMPEEGMDRDEYVARKFGSSDRAHKIYDAIRGAGAEEGIAFDFRRIGRTPNTVASHRLIRWAGSAGVQHKVVELIFDRYFVRGDDIGNPAVLTDIAREAGMDADLVAELLARDADVDQVRAEDQVARDLGIAGVPCFIVDRKYAISGAQDPAVFLQVFDLALRGDAPAQESAEAMGT